MDNLEPKYFDFTKYTDKAILSFDVRQYINNDIFLSDIEKEIIDWNNIPIDSTFIRISFDKEYFILAVEKCSFCGYLLKNLEDKNKYSLLFNSIESQQNISIDMNEAQYSIYGCQDTSRIVSSILSYYQSFTKAKDKINNKLNKTKELILALDDIIKLDKENISYIEHNHLLDPKITPYDSMFQKIINDLQVTLLNYYKANRLYFMDGKENNNDFITEIKSLLDLKKVVEK